MFSSLSASPQSPQKTFAACPFHAQLSSVLGTAGAYVAYLHKSKEFGLVSN